VVQDDVSFNWRQRCGVRGILELDGRVEDLENALARGDGT
jgi:hypothetical protein